MTSDHNPVLFNIDYTLQNNNIPNWEKFNYLLSTATFTPGNLTTQQGIENSIQHLTQLITITSTKPSILTSSHLCNKRLTWHQHVTNIIQKFRTAKSILYPLLSKNSHLDLNNKHIIYKSILKPILTYAAPIWGYAAPTHIKKNHSSQTKILRHISDSPWYFRNDQISKEHEIPHIENFFRHLADNFYSNLPNINNSLLQVLPEYDITALINKRRPKAILNN
ncbi:RNA-directed DNA polymerase from mobile element jockey [Caerostris extrusa]|uniref:RNA-directed DNA polymerase from mobile element jockey n=1 Tax=Caerostris extrusa TaxID=172846 RepID=A0AAV4NKR6_CAEEX|nr:RNA-directed DNA polymerase from mobile element jockey [Caerostris extrusa]